MKTNDRLFSSPIPKGREPTTLEQFEELGQAFRNVGISIKEACNFYPFTQKNHDTK